MGSHRLGMGGPGRVPRHRVCLLRGASCRFKRSHPAVAAAHRTDRPGSVGVAGNAGGMSVGLGDDDSGHGARRVPGPSDVLGHASASAPVAGVRHRPDVSHASEPGPHGAEHSWQCRHPRRRQSWMRCQQSPAGARSHGALATSITGMVALVVSCVLVATHPSADLIFI